MTNQDLPPSKTVEEQEVVIVPVKAQAFIEQLVNSHQEISHTQIHVHNKEHWNQLYQSLLLTPDQVRQGDNISVRESVLLVRLLL